MYALQGADFARPVSLARAVNMVAQDPADLLIGWLNRLLSYQEINGEIYTRFRITDIGPQGLIGVAFGYHGLPVRAGIKAATYWNLTIRTEAGKCAATVTFDV